MERKIDGTKYNFKMTRKGIRAAEKAGMSIAELSERPMSALYYLWYAALYTNHPLPIKKSDALLDKYLDDENCPESFQDVLESLSGDYAEVFGQAVE